MDKIKIKGGANLFGSINIPGSKNAALPVMVSSLLSKENLNLHNLPKLQDMNSMISLLRSFGVSVNQNNHTLTLNSQNLKNSTASYDLVRKMRASILVLGPLLSRFREAKISLPGGCAIGTRPIDIHLDGLSKLGVDFEIDNGFVKGRV
ncbi:MAG TPA: UDP-N-acetylglucosamine 1-carboxyvinyltransferase, partial [Pelagibacterales bacterium]|nr:UDP-N-acetylglucosamine 1-carboxyvinyltransferase [Pelagibacterales bacterium]